MRAVAALLAGACALAPAAARAFSNVAVGDPIRERDLSAAAGGKAPLLGQARASVLVFFRSDSENSLTALRELSFVERDFVPKGVRFVAIVSDADDLERARATLRESGARMPLLVDVGDALYGELGVRLHPVVGVVDSRRRLSAYEHFRKVGFRSIVRGRIRVALGELSVAEMEQLLSPPEARSGDELAPARREVALGRMELARGQAAKAEEIARKALGLAPAHAPAHVLLGKALAAQGRCPEARKAFEEALRLAPGTAEAAEGLRGCAGR